ncbi:MAG: GNAT family N-acetyltransferase [Flavobacteriaceae bacterium]|nr:GNAT family N-acetyltransferase [Flavobacteriaceae bacterium]
MSKIQIRPIQHQDNQKLGELIQLVLEGENAPKTGTAYADKHLFNLSEAYLHPKAQYFVITKKDEILGGAGIGLLNGEKNICELQKMYFHKSIRGQGWAEKMINTCLNFAQKAGFTHCYIETLPFMKAARKRYEKSGFQYIEERLGNTEHFSCTTFMLKEL